MSPSRDCLTRSPSARIVRAKDALILVHADGASSRLEGDSAALAEAVLSFFDRPRARAEIVERVRALSEGPFDEKVVHDLLDVLERVGAIGSERPSQRVARVSLRLVLCVTGAIQAMDAPRLVALLQRRGVEVRVAATNAAKEFVSVAALEALTHREVHTSLRGSVDRPAAHVDLAQWADMVVVAPASATTIGRVARGDFSCVVAATALTTRAPVVIAPSMNEDMLSSSAVARNLATLRDDGFFLVDPCFGVEVALAPASRAPTFGSAPPAERMDEIVVALSRALGAARVDWESVFDDEGAELSWACEDAPQDLAAELARFAPPAIVLDVGTGLGSIAVHAAKRGHHVVATDVSHRALIRARARAGSLPITFLRDDIRDTRLASAFDVVVDRGCMHVLRDGELDAYVAAMTRLVRPGGELLLVFDGLEAPLDRQTLRRTPDAVAERLAGFTLERAARTTIAADAPNAAWLTVWKRNV